MLNDGGSAFPNVPDGAGDKWQDWDKGMTLRDYFAAKALPSIVIICVDDPRGGKDYPEYCAEQSYQMADAMLKAREQ